MVLDYHQENKFGEIPMKLILQNWFTIAKLPVKIFSIAIFLFISTIKPQWNTQSPLPTHLDVRGIGAPSAQKVFIATDDNSFDDGGALFESNDGGATWIQRNVPISLGDPFNGLFFLDSLHGWAFGNDNYKTTDGGTTWVQLPFLGSTYFMKFYTQSFGLTTGNFGRYVSYDGGDNWVESPNGMFYFSFINNVNGLGVADSSIYLTTDGGISFNEVYTGFSKAAEFLSSNISVGIVDDTFIRSTDGGLTWNPVSSANEKTKLLPVSTDVCIAWGRAGTFPNITHNLFRTSDGGQTWNDLGEVIPDGVFAFSVVDNQHIVASDVNGNMYYSADAGLSWSQTFSSPGQMPSFLSSAAPHFADSQTGYFGYGSGFVIKTTDGGALAVAHDSTENAVVSRRQELGRQQ